MKSSSEFKQATRAVTGNNTRMLRDLLTSDPELAFDPRLLNTAALHGHADTVEILLSHGADADGQVASHEYYRPLHRAIEHRGVSKNPGHRQVIELLLATGASRHLRATWMQLTPLAVAGMTGDEEFVALLRKKSPPLDIFTAAILADARQVERFLENDASLAASKDLNAMTALHYAALGGSPEKADAFRKIAISLLQAGANGNARETIGPYPPTAVLHFAAWKNYAVAETLLQHGCDPDGGFGNCLWKPPGAMAELFFSHGANVNQRDREGIPLLNSRIHWNLPSVALWLLEKGADPNQTDPLGNSALHAAALRGINPQVVAALLKSGARKNTKNQAGKTAHDIAREKERTKLIPLLQ